MVGRRIELVFYALLALAVAASAILPLAMPELSASGAEAMFLLMVAIGYVVGFNAWGVRRGAAMFALSFAAGLIIENIGIATGFPFGPFYHTMPGPYIGLAPLASGFGYFPFIAIGWAYADLVLGQARVTDRFRTAVKIVLAALVGGMVEMIYDPLEALLLDRWVFPAGGSFFGTPASNLFGWGLTIAVSLLLFDLIVRHMGPSGSSEPRFDLSVPLCVALVCEPLPLLICHALAPASTVADPSGALWDSSALYGVMGTFGLAFFGLACLVGLAACLDRRRKERGGA